MKERDNKLLKLFIHLRKKNISFLFYLLLSLFFSIYVTLYHIKNESNPTHKHFILLRPFLFFSLALSLSVSLLHKVFITLHVLYILWVKIVFFFLLSQKNFKEIKSFKLFYFLSSLFQKSNLFEEENFQFFFSRKKLCS